MDRYASKLSELFGTDAAHNISMASHDAMMHYALQQRKCFLHHAYGYVGMMGPSNDRLRAVRERRYDTAKEAAEAIRVAVATYIQHENGTRGSGSIPRRAAERYAKFFRVSLDWLLTGKGEEPANEPTEGDLEVMLREVIETELTVSTRIADLPRIVAAGDGSKLTMRFGNPTSATINDFGFHAQYGPVDKDDDLIAEEAKEADRKLAIALEPGAWNTATVTLPGVPPTRFARLVLTKTTVPSLSLKK